MRCVIFGKGGMSAGIASVLEGEGHEVIEYEHFEVDVTDPIAVRFVLGYKEPDWVINCAGMSDERQPLNTLMTNLWGSMVVARATQQIPTILIASVAGLYGKPNHTAYCVSKAGVISLVQSLGFTQPIWAISPGRVDTPMRERDYPGDTPGSRLEPEQIGTVVRDIMADRYPSGENIIVRKVGLSLTKEYPEQNPWRQRLRVGEPVTI